MTAPPLIAIAVDPVIIGRSGTAGQRLLHPTISRHHATVRRVGHGLVVSDQDSRFGTFVNGVRIRSALLRDGDRVRFGAVTTYRVGSDGLRLETLARGMSLTVTDLAFTVPHATGRQRLLYAIDLEIQPDSLTGILGPSGAGKSTLLNCLAGIVLPDRGQICCDAGHDSALDTEAYLAVAGHVAQDDVVFLGLTVRENLASAARIRLGRGGVRGGIDALIAQVLERVALTEHAEKRTLFLSGGQRKRLSVAIELLRRPRLLLLDEPTSGLDPASETHLMEQLRHLTRQGTTVVCTTHLMDNLRLCDTVVVLGVIASVGRVAYVGTPEGLLPHFACRGFADLYELLAAGRFEPLVPRVDLSETELDGAGIVPNQVAEPRSDSTRSKTRIDPSLSPPDPGRVHQLATTGSGVIGLDQAWVVAQRAIRLTLRDRGLVLAMVAQPVGLGVLVALAQYDASKPLPILFFALVIAVWLGLNNSARDLVGERRLYVRDRRAGLDPWTYLGAKALVHIAFGMGQIVILLVALRIGCGLVLDPVVAQSFGHVSRPKLLATLLLIYSGGVGLGFLVSTLVRTGEAAVAALPLLIMPQLLLSAVATGAQDEPYSRARAFRPLAVTFLSEQKLSWPATLVDGLSLLCIARPAVLVAEAPAVATYGRWIWLGDLAHLVVLLGVTWVMVVLAFRHAERSWLRPTGS